jgi:hypothetical protein
VGSLNGDLEARVSALEERLRKLEDRNVGEPQASAPPDKKLSIQEFLRSKKPKSDVDRTLLVAYFSERFAGVSPFNLADLRDEFARAREPLPANLSDAINKNIQKGLMMEAAERKGGFKSWLITNSAEELIRARDSIGD